MTHFKILMNPQPEPNVDTVIEVIGRCPFPKGMSVGDEVVTDVAVINIKGLFYWSVLIGCPKPLPWPTRFDRPSACQFIQAASWPQLKRFCAELVERLHGVMDELDSEERWANHYWGRGGPA